MFGFRACGLVRGVLVWWLGLRWMLGGTGARALWDGERAAGNSGGNSRDNCVCVCVCVCVFFFLFPPPLPSVFLRFRPGRGRAAILELPLVSGNSGGNSREN